MRRQHVVSLENSLPSPNQPTQPQPNKVPIQAMGQAIQTGEKFLILSSK